MARADSNHTTKPLSSLIRDPFVAAAFRRAEDDGLASEPLAVDQPRTLGGGAAVRPELEMA